MRAATLLLLLSTAIFRAAVTGDSTESIRAMSFNIRYGTADDGSNSWEFRRDLVMETIRQHDPDILGVQEALAFQIQELEEAMPGHRRIGVGREDGVAAGEFAAIFYRSERFDVDTSGTFWLSETPEVPGSMHWGNHITRICTWARLIESDGNRALYVFNLHLDHQSQPSRERSVELVARNIEGRLHDDPVILMGDFNAGEDNPAMRYLRGEAGASPIRLTDTFRALHPDERETGTFGAWVGETSGDRIDAILVLDFSVLEAGILHANQGGRFPSDHFPVTAGLQWLR
jgi:endonuclease/exonuclease/phosphatase family metal-dependent hydrolase